MKRILVTQLIVGMMAVWPVVANAATDNAPQINQNQNAPAVQVEGKAKVDATVKDKRIITPDMNYRERVETQRAYQKRAAAKRNSLMQAAELERKQQDKNAETSGKPEAK